MIKLKLLLEDFKIPSGKWVDYDLIKIPEDGMENIWTMYSTSYIKANLDLSAQNWQELQRKYKAVALYDVDNDQIPDAVIIYKTGKFGNKIALLATNDKKDAKRELIKHAIELTKTRGWFIEASAKMEDIMKSSGAPVVTDKDKIIAILGTDKKPEFMDDGYYTRSLSKVDKRIVKRIYGKPL
jgi:hypothetical protein